MLIPAKLRGSKRAVWRWNRRQTWRTVNLRTY